MTPVELFLLMNHDRKYLYYDVYDLCFTDSAINRREFKIICFQEKKSRDEIPKIKYYASNFQRNTL